jgi:hypothetical protein
MTRAGRIFTQTLKAVIVGIWLFIGYIIIDLIGQQIEFARSMGGLF